MKATTYQAIYAIAVRGGKTVHAVQTMPPLSEAEVRRLLDAGAIIELTDEPAAEGQPPESLLDVSEEALHEIVDVSDEEFHEMVAGMSLKDLKTTAAELDLAPGDATTKADFIALIAAARQVPST